MFSNFSLRAPLTRLSIDPWPCIQWRRQGGGGGVALPPPPEFYSYIFVLLIVSVGRTPLRNVCEKVGGGGNV